MTTLLRLVQRAWRSVRDLDGRTALRQRIETAIK